ncbi:hypothetical protein QBC47DRAFT_448781 [Echria macrotheca]|uniref:Thioredoxin domain-containing protein n=1 Tax=Echria macrotheca TaxID=438768 RepID=A0AAJ0BN22_9PEZI|nr:hypothetical protein QBC47DRAFT_448781 [Echria macrotheca]
MRLTTLLLIPPALGWSHFSGDSFERALEENEYTLVACNEKSTSLEQEWTFPAIPSIEVTSIDCIYSKSLCANYTVSSLPTIRLYHHATLLQRYRGPRRTSSIVSFVKRMTTRPCNEIPTIDASEISTFLSSDEVTFLAHLPSTSLIREHFEAQAKKYRDRYTFGITSDTRDGGRIECYNREDEMHHVLEVKEIGLVPSEGIETFVKKCATPLIPELTRRNEMEIYQSGKSLLHYLPPSPLHLQIFHQQVRPLAKKYQEYLTFLTTSPSEFPDAPSMLGLEDEGGVGLAVQNPATGEVYRYPFRGDLPVRAGEVEGFLGDIVRGKVKAWNRRGDGGGGGRGHEEL